MSKRKQSKSSTTRKKAGAGTSKGKSTHSNRSKVPAAAPAEVQTLYQKTRRRIRDIAKRALSKLRGGDTNK